jgi:hypothetical protein
MMFRSDSEGFDGAYRAGAAANFSGREPGPLLAVFIVERVEPSRPNFKEEL